MNYVDLRLGKILSDTRIEEAERLRDQRLHAKSRSRQIKIRLGSWLIARGERLVEARPKIA